MRHVPEAEKVEKRNLRAPHGSMNQHTWWVLSPAGREALAAYARETTVADLDSAVRVRSEATIRKKAMLVLAEQGMHECPTCCGPVLDTDDPQYEQKDELMQRIGKRGAFLKCCECDHPDGMGVCG